MVDKLPIATHTGKIKIKDIMIPCAVLDDHRRIINQEGLWQTLGISESDFLVDSKFKSSNPILFKNLNGIETIGYPAELLTNICQVYLDTKETKPLNQKLVARCNTLIRELTIIGMIPLVDEATGYQRDKDKQILNKILEDYFSNELASWAKQLPEEFYQNLFRLRRLQHNPLSLKRPKYIGKLVNELIFSQLSPDVLEELKQKNPDNMKANDIHNHHLDRQIIRVITLMQVSPNWRVFESLFARAHPISIQDKKVSL